MISYRVGIVLPFILRFPFCTIIHLDYVMISILEFVFQFMPIILFMYDKCNSQPNLGCSEKKVLLN